MSNDHKLNLMRGLTKTAIATLTANRSGPAMNQEARPQIQAATDNVAIQNSLSKGQRLLAPPPPPGSGRAKKPLAVKTKSPKTMNTAKFGTGMPKMGKADTKRFLVEALMEKRANRFRGAYEGAKGIYKGIRNWYNGPVSVPQSAAVPVTQNVKGSFRKGFTDAFRSKASREALNVQRNVLKEQRKISDSLIGQPTSATARDAFNLAGPTPRLFGQPKLPTVGNMPRAFKRKPTLGPESATSQGRGFQILTRNKTTKDAAREAYANTQRSLARNELAAGAGRVVGGIARGTGKVVGTTAGVGALGGMGYHFYANPTGGLGVMGRTALGGAKDTTSALTSLLPGGKPMGVSMKNTMKAADEPFINVPKNYKPQDLSASQRRVNKVPDEAYRLSQQTGGNLKESNAILAAKNSKYRLNDKWQYVDAGQPIGANAAFNVDKSGVYVSPSRSKARSNAQSVVDMFRRRAAKRNQRNLDDAVQSGGK